MWQSLCSGLVLLLLVLTSRGSITNFGLTSQTLLPHEIDSSVLNNFVSYSNPPEPLDRRSIKLCDVITRVPKQRSMCRRHHDLALPLADAISIAVSECQWQFRDERWNCSLGQGRLQLLKKDFPETAILRSMQVAALVHTLARTCTQLGGVHCTCSRTKQTKEPIQNQISSRPERSGDPYKFNEWKWGHCGENLEFAIDFTRKFIIRNKVAHDIREAVEIHNVRLGIAEVRKSQKLLCKCHGVSASCTVRTCWKSLGDFRLISSAIKDRFQAKRRVSLPNDVMYRRRSEFHVQLDSTAAGNEPEQARRRLLLYIDQAPDFCERSAFSPDGTAGRRCYDVANCDNLCCGRGFRRVNSTTKTSCRCQFKWCCRVKCDTCIQNEELLLCNP